MSDGFRRLVSKPGVLLSTEERAVERDSLETPTFCPALPQLTVLNEASKHLRFHKDAQEAADALGGHRLAEGLALEDTVTSLTLGHEQRVMADGLQEEPNEGLRHQAV